MSHRGPFRQLFAALAGCAFILCLFAGVFLTSDSLSEEKREGTLGLLFLSSLLGSDIVLGKFSALALNAFFRRLCVTFFPSCNPFNFFNPCNPLFCAFSRGNFIRVH